ncbi:DUF4825 domain-containing protein [Faecalimonas sp.]
MMKNKLPCGVIEDLLPLYVEQLTSDCTKEMIEGHIETCTKCREKLERMQKPSMYEKNDEEEMEIDFLKKTKKGYRKKIVISMISVLALCILVFLGKTFIVGEKVSPELIVNHIGVKNNEITVQATSIVEDIQIKNIGFKEKDGILELTYRGVPSMRTDTTLPYEKTYSAKGKIKEIKVGNRIVWHNEKKISKLTSDVFNSRHDYIGDPSKNAKTMEALGVGEVLGTYENELQTKKEPYGWKITLKEPIQPNEKTMKIEKMKAYSCVLLGVIRNLGEITFEYSNLGKQETMTITAEEATNYFGKNIKIVGTEIEELEALVDFYTLL